MIEEADLRQTGGDLIGAKSGIILHPLGDRTVRDLSLGVAAGAMNSMSSRVSLTSKTQIDGTTANLLFS